MKEVYNDFLFDQELSLKAKGLMTIMITQNLECVSIETMASYSSDGRTAVVSALKELEDKKYLIRYQDASGHRFASYEYTYNGSKLKN